MNLMEEKFFFQYHLHYDMDKAMRLPIIERRFYIERFIAQKEREQEHLEKEQKKAQRIKKH